MKRKRRKKTDVKQQVIFRLYPDIHDAVKEQCAKDKITFQTFCEVMVYSYIKGNKEIDRLIETHGHKKYARRRSTVLDPLDADELLHIIEEEHSPLRELDKIIEKELEEEDFNKDE
jgi:hypothetical protein